MAKRMRSAAERAAQVDGLRSRPARGRILAAARELAEAKGYEALAVGELAATAGVSRETFYTHFADKRACLAEATGPRLGEIEQLLRISIEEGEEWAKPLIAGVDEQLSRRFDSERGPRARILAAMVELAARHGFASVRLADIVKAAHVSYPSFYRCFESKEQCFEVAQQELVERLSDRVAPAEPDGSEAEAAQPGLVQLRALAQILADERDAARILLLEGGVTIEGTERSASSTGSTPLAGLIVWLAKEALVANREGKSSSSESVYGNMQVDVTAQLLGGALVEVMRKELLAGEPEEIPVAVEALLAALVDGHHPQPRSKASGRRRAERGRPSSARRTARTAVVT